MSLFALTPNTSFTTIQPATAAPTINSGINSGNTFDSRGNDFLNPNTIGGNINDFSSSISPVTSNTLTSQLISSNIFGSNPDNRSISSNTNSQLANILSPNFGSNIVFQVPILPIPSIQPIPDLGINPDPTEIVLSTLFFAQNIQPPTPAFNPNNFNPLLWHNPTAGNILLGTLGAGGNILNGINPGSPPLSPFFGSPMSNNPFGGFGSFGGFGGFGQPMLAGFGVQTSMVPIFASPFQMPAFNQPEPAFVNQEIEMVASMIDTIGTMLAEMLAQLFQPEQPQAVAGTIADEAQATGGTTTPTTETPAVTLQPTDAATAATPAVVVATPTVPTVDATVYTAETTYAV